LDGVVVGVDGDGNSYIFADRDNVEETLAGVVVLCNGVDGVVVGVDGDGNSYIFADRDNVEATLAGVVVLCNGVGAFVRNQKVNVTKIRVMQTKMNEETMSDTSDKGKHNGDDNDHVTCVTGNDDEHEDSDVTKRDDGIPVDPANGLMKVAKQDGTVVKEATNPTVEMDGWEALKTTVRKAKTMEEYIVVSGHAYEEKLSGKCVVVFEPNSYLNIST
jgi:hypothetical protein